MHYRTLRQGWLRLLPTRVVLNSTELSISELMPVIQALKLFLHKEALVGMTKSLHMHLEFCWMQKKFSVMEKMYLPFCGLHENLEHQVPDTLP